MLWVDHQAMSNSMQWLIARFWRYAPPVWWSLCVLRISNINGFILLLKVEQVTVIYPFLICQIFEQYILVLINIMRKLLHWNWIKSWRFRFSAQLEVKIGRFKRTWYLFPLAKKYQCMADNHNYKTQCNNIKKIKSFKSLFKPLNVWKGWNFGKVLWDVSNFVRKIAKFLLWMYAAFISKLILSSWSLDEFYYKNIFK